MLKGNGEGAFEAVPAQESGLYIKGDVRQAKIISTKEGKDYILFASNNEKPAMVKMKSVASSITIK